MTQILTANKKDMCYCPGCSHGELLEKIGGALDQLQRETTDICLVSDIGCIGTADRYFACHTFHGLHGRCFTYAEGIARMQPDLLVVALVGDGGCGIGTAHLIHAARRNAPFKVIVCNNFNFGMTGGQHSPTSPPGGVTPTTPSGIADQPFDICQTVMANGANFVGRASALDPQCTEQIAEALRAPGFALIDVWGLCVAYFAPKNKLTRKGLEELSNKLNMPFGVLRSSPPEPAAPRAAPERPQDTQTPRGDTKTLSWPGRIEMTIAGSAGQHVRAACAAIGRIAAGSGLFATAHDDFPITVRKGFSVSSLIVDNQPVLYSGVDHPDAVIILSDDGLARLGDLSHLSPQSKVFADQQLASETLDSAAAPIERLDLQQFTRSCGSAGAALGVLARVIVARGWLAADELIAAAESCLSGPHRDNQLKAITVGCKRQNV